MDGARIAFKAERNSELCLPTLASKRRAYKFGTTTIRMLASRRLLKSVLNGVAFGSRG